MSKHNFDNVEEVSDYSVLNPGKYPVKIYECEAREAKTGNKTWNIKMEVLKGDRTGRRVFDNITWIDSCLPRAKLIISRCGISLKNGIDDDDPAILEGKTALVNVESIIDEYSEKDENGNPKPRNKVAFAGYEKWAPGDSVPKSTSKEADVPDESDEAPPF